MSTAHLKANANTSASAGVSSHAVSRTTELLSCARTALKIARAQNPPPSAQDWWLIDPSLLELHSDKREIVHYPQIGILSDDGLALLRAMQVSLEKLQGLVKRRGNVNDPTHEIASCTRQLETDAKELTTIVEQLKAFRSTNPQHRKHISFIAEWLQSMASQQTAKLKEILKVRGTVLADQAQRRKLWNPQTKPSVSSSVATKSTIQQSPLFAMAPSKPPSDRRAPSLNGSTTTNSRLSRVSPAPANEAYRMSNPNGGNITTTASAAAASTTGNGYGVSGYGGESNSAHGYGGVTTSSGYGGYGAYYGGTAAATNTGMRQRRNNNLAVHEPNAATAAAVVQQQVQMRQEERKTQSRLEHANQAEKSLAELSTLFGKMSSLIVAQGETLEKIEDDVEAAHMDVTAGQAEIQILYSLKKGNRALILKTFAVVIFVILFMRLY